MCKGPGAAGSLQAPEGWSGLLREWMKSACVWWNQSREGGAHSILHLLPRSVDFTLKATANPRLKLLNIFLMTEELIPVPKVKPLRIFSVFHSDTCLFFFLVFLFIYLFMNWWLSGKESTGQCRRCRRLRFNPWVKKIPLEKETATHSSILARRIPWTEEPWGL